MGDVVLIMQSLANPNKYKLSEPGLYNADVFEAGSGITSNDALSIQKYLLSLITKLPESWSNNLKAEPIEQPATQAPTTQPTTEATTQPTTQATTTTQAPVAKTLLKNSFDSSTESWAGRGNASVEISGDSYYSGKSLYVTGRSAE
jgi:cell wall-associated NlpC family hydrolase